MSAGISNNNSQRERIDCLGKSKSVGYKKTHMFIYAKCEPLIEQSVMHGGRIQ